MEGVLTGNYSVVSTSIIGRIAMSEEDAAMLEKYAAMCSSWIEIGTLWGGSAILAAMANPLSQVIAIDPGDGYYESGQPDDWDPEHGVPNEKIIRANFTLFGVEERIRLVLSKSAPWPLPHQKVADAVFIDGSHETVDVASDCRNALRVASRFILVHDMDNPDIRALVCSLVRWETVDSCERMHVFRRE